MPESVDGSYFELYCDGALSQAGGSLTRRRCWVMMAKYEVWARTGTTRKRVSPGFATEAEAQAKLRKLEAEGFTDLVVVQRPPSYGNIKGQTKKGRSAGDN
jgi:hypothetical protein